MRRYVAEKELDWVGFVQLLTYVCNLQVHRSTGTNLFDTFFRNTDLVLSSQLVQQAAVPLGHNMPLK